VLKQGINRSRVEEMEARLKEDILMEAARYLLWLNAVLSLVCNDTSFLPLVTIGLNYNIYSCVFHLQIWK
jgi:hypothetical protein